MKNTPSFKKYILQILLLVNCFVLVHADPPEPPAGKVWILNHDMSDEFDASSPNIEKWNVFDKGNSWDRTAAFDKRVHEAVKDPASNNYYLTMNPMWYYEDERFTSSGGRTYNFAGGGMNTYAMQTYGYFEVRIKPSDFPMGSGVFMNSRGTTAGSCDEKYATELDIIENMGYTGPGGTRTFNNYQHVNSHAKPYSDEGGSCQGLPYESTNSGVSGKLLAEPLGFNTVGMWWKDEKTAAFYNNDVYFGTITPKRDFYLPMPIILTMETYGWGNDENNATNPKPEEWMFEDEFRSKEQRAVTYDWVRVWKLIDIDETELNDAVDKVKVLNDTLTDYPTNKLSTTLIYSSSENRTIIAKLYSPEHNVLAEKSFDVTKGVRSIFTEFNLLSDLTVGNDYKIVYELKNEDVILSSDTSIVNLISKPLEKKLWREGIPTSLVPGKSSYNIDVKYETDINSTVVIEIRKPDGSWFGGGSKNVTPGNGIVTVTANTSSATTAAANYFYKIYMHGQGLDWRDPLLVSISPTIYFNVEAPLSPSIAIISAPSEIQNNANDVDVEFEYTTTENGTLDIELINHKGEVVAQEHRTERIGSRTLSRSIDIDSTLTPSNDYKIAIQFSPENGGFGILRDTLHQVSIVGSSSAIAGLKSNTKQISLYPNPAKDMITIDISSAVGILQSIEVFDMNGKKVSVIAISKHTIPATVDVSDLRSGIYFVKLMTDKEVYTARFAKGE